MLTVKALAGIKIRRLIPGLIALLFLFCTGCHNEKAGNREQGSYVKPDSSGKVAANEESAVFNAMLVLPRNPGPGEPFRILLAGGEKIRKAKILIDGPSGRLESLKSKNGGELPCWRTDDFEGGTAGRYRVTMTENNKEISNIEFTISPGEMTKQPGIIWKTVKAWDSDMEKVYSAWINALFHDCDEQSSWSALHEVTRDQNQNFLHNYLSLGEDDRDGKNIVIMQPDCADNPFFLRAYFSWKLGLPFGYHICDRGYLNHNPKAGRWITNETPTSKTHPVPAFNDFLRKMMDGVHSGTARTALDDANSDYYPISLERRALLPGTVFADPYGHTLIITGFVPQTRDKPGLLLSVDAQPDGTVGIKRFWKGNYLFNTAGVVGEPGFKAFRPVSVNKGVSYLMKNNELTAEAGFVPFSLQQRKMLSDVFYNTMERIINPEPLDPEDALTDLIEALHEQLLVRIISVANGEEYFKSHPGAVIAMPSNAAGIFQAGGQWENFSTPNRDLRLLIAMDEVLGFPDHVTRSPENFKISGLVSPDHMRKKLQSELDKIVSGLSISYKRTNGSLQKLTLYELLKRRDAFEMAYNPNDGIEIRWGAPENSEERATCKRQAPPIQAEMMRAVRTWFNRRLHPPT
jgi:hypothetical protein